MANGHRVLLVLLLTWLTRLNGIATVAQDSAQVGRAVIDDPVVAVIEEAGLIDGSLIRITRDYNNDGRDDLVLGWSETCGNATCGLELFAQREDGRFTRAGEIGGLPFGFRLVPVAPGRSRLETCTRRGDQVAYTTAVITATQVTDGDERIVTQDEAQELCQWPKATWEECAISEYRNTGQCVWTVRTWP